MKFLLEVNATSVEDALNTEAGGADRIELIDLRIGHPVSIAEEMCWFLRQRNESSNL